MYVHVYKKLIKTYREFKNAPTHVNTLTAVISKSYSILFSKSLQQSNAKKLHIKYTYVYVYLVCMYATIQFLATLNYKIVRYGFGTVFGCSCNMWKFLHL